MVPISLIISLEMVKVMQAVMIKNDIRMKKKDSDEGKQFANVLSFS